MDLSKILEALARLSGRKHSVTLVTIAVLAYVGAHPAWIAAVGGLFTLIQGLDDLMEDRRARPPAAPVETKPQ